MSAEAQHSLRQWLNEIVNERNTTAPDGILSDIRFGIIKALKQSGASGEQRDGMDMALCTLDTKTRKLQYAGANNPLWVIRKGNGKDASPEPVQ